MVANVVVVLVLVICHAALAAGNCPLSTCLLTSVYLSADLR